MEIILKLMVVMACIVLMLKKRIALGHSMLVASGVLFLLVAPQFAVLKDTVWLTATSIGTWKLMLAMYLVMCLEYQLRTTGVLDRFMDTVKRVFSDRVLLAVMPGVIGFLPSFGGAIMSCPMVESASKNLQVSQDKKSTINYWFRHIGEYANPIVPGMLLASEILKMPLRDLLIVIAPFGALSFVVGWLFLITTVKVDSKMSKPEGKAGSSLKHISMALGPILFNMVLVVAFNMDAAMGLALVITVMALILRQSLGNIGAMFKAAYNFKLLWGVFGIICFQNMFHTSGAVKQFIEYMGTTAISLDFVVMMVAFMGGLLCGVGQSVIALAFPIIAAMGSADMTLIVCAYVFGTAGQMISPVHLCYPLTVEYFRADMVKSMLPVIYMELIMMASVFIITQVIL